MKAMSRFKIRENFFLQSK